MLYWVLKTFIYQYAPSVFDWISRFLGIVSILLGIAALVKLIGIFQSDSSNVMRATYEVKLFFGHKNLLCSFLFLLLPFNLIGYLQSNTNKVWKYLYLSNIILLSLLPLLLLCRSVFLALIVSGLCVFIWQYRQQQWSGKKTLQIGGAVLALFCFALLIYAFMSDSSTLLSRFNPIDMMRSFTAQERFLIWQKNALLIQQHALLGIGAGNWFIEFPSNGIESIPRMAISNKILIRPHNDYLWIWTEVGIGGLVLFISFIGWHIFQAIRKGASQVSVAPKQRIYIALFALLGYLIISFFDFPRERIEHQMLLALLLIYMLVGDVAPPPPPTKNKKKAKKGINTWKNYAILGTCFSFLALCLFVGWHRVQGEMASKKMYTYNDQKNYPKVGQYAQKALNPFYTVDPLSYPLDYWHGFAMARENKREAAIKAFEKAIEYNPYHFQLLSNLGLTHLQQKNTKLAEKHLLASHCINNQYKRNNELLALYYYTLKRYGEARKYVQFVRDSKSPEAASPEFEAMAKQLEGM